MSLSDLNCEQSSNKVAGMVRKSPGLPQFSRGPLHIQFFTATVLVVAASALRQTMMHYLDVNLPPFITFYPAVMIVAMLCGFWPGLFATVLASLLAIYWVFEPVGVFAIANTPDALALALFFAMGILMSAIAHRHRRNYEHLAAHQRKQALRDADKELHQQAEHSEERFRSVVESAPVGICIQTGGLVRYLNTAALNMFGAKIVDQIIGQTFLVRIHPDSRAASAERARIVEEERKPIPLLTEHLLRLDGSSFHAEVTTVPFFFEGSNGSIAFFLDISERKREEEKKSALEQQLRQSQKLEALGRLAGGVAHDFNNLLTVIRTYTEMLHDRLPADDNLRRNTEQILEAAERGASLTGQMLAFSRNQMVSPLVLDLNAVIDEAAKMLKRVIGEDIEFRVISEPSLWAMKADPDQIFQVLMNLCVNSRDAMPHGGTLTIETHNVTVKEENVSKRPYVEPGKYVMLSVTDSGIGMSKEIQEHIFEPFYTTKEAGKGTGLGLAMAHGIVKQSSGYMWVDSELGQGACFTIYLPEVKRAVAPTVPAKAGAPPRGTEILLVVEDEEFIRKGICEFLRSLGYTCLAASSGQKALSIASQREHIDLLLTDVVMPKMGGRELSQVLGSQRPDLKIIHMSGYTDDAVLQSGVYASRTAFLQKPFSLGTLARKVRATLDRPNHYEL